MGRVLSALLFCLLASGFFVALLYYPAPKDDSKGYKKTVLPNGNTIFERIK